MERTRTARRLAAAVAGVGAVCVGFYWFASVPSDTLGLGAELRNVREVDPGRFYRSGQLSPATLREVADAFGIRTVISLRGYDAGSDWHDAEVAVTRDLGIAHHDVHLSASSLPHREQILKLLKLYREADRPLLVHCATGASRTGEASALYGIEYMGHTKEQALAMLTLRHRYWSWLHPAKRAFVRAYRGKTWVREQYDPCSPEWGDLDRPSLCDEPRETTMR